ncbi:hypothetical protein HHK36_016524 [Tetracentron sinense]|uniref:Uncharacterized protein n=1 Tax=Tetracentron sinense TaxID=13715 RepID=A0A834YXC7_TETSI|nr:hypothetical protein HHK36_016524 [Tetracentron sinense]
MEMVKQDNRRQLSARNLFEKRYMVQKNNVLIDYAHREVNMVGYSFVSYCVFQVEQLEQEVTELRQALADKQEQEHAMLQVLMRVEQEQRVTEDARRFAEQDATAQRYAAHVLQEKYEEAVASLAQMEKRIVMAESMLEATLQYQSGQVKAQPSPRSVHSDSLAVQVNQEPTQDLPTRKIGLLSRPFGLGWRDRNKGKPTNVEEPMDSKSTDELQSPGTLQKDLNGHQEEHLK